MDDDVLTVIEKSLHVNKNIWKCGKLLFVLQQLSQVVGDALCVVVGLVAHRVLDEIQDEAGNFFSEEEIRIEKKIKKSCPKV
jgi:hypothetical protein